MEKKTFVELILWSLDEVPSNLDFVLWKYSHRDLKHLTRIKVEDRMVSALQERSTLQEVMSDLAIAVFGSKKDKAKEAPQTFGELAQIIQAAGGSVR